MKRTIYLFTTLLAICIILGGCKKKKDSTSIPDNAADFTYSTDNKGGITVSLTNYQNNINYTLDIGDGTIIKVDPLVNTYKVDGAGDGVRKYFYKNNGNYTIKVDAKDNNNNTKESTQNVTISTVPSKVKITYFKLKDYPSLNPANGSNWDPDASGPDLYFAYSFDPYYGATQNPYINISKGILPIQLNTDTISIDIKSMYFTQVSVAAYDYDNALNSDKITQVYYYLKDATSQGSTYKTNTDNNAMYPSILSDSYLEVGLDWIP